MFRGLINDAKSAASSLVLKYVARASIAIPFVIALGFALAALTVWLVNQYGHVTGYLLMAGGSAAVRHRRPSRVVQGTRGWLEAVWARAHRLGILALTRRPEQSTGRDEQ